MSSEEQSQEEETAALRTRVRQAQCKEAKRQDSSSRCNALSGGRGYAQKYISFVPYAPHSRGLELGIFLECQALTARLS